MNENDTFAVELLESHKYIFPNATPQRILYDHAIARIRRCAELEAEREKYRKLYARLLADNLIQSFDKCTDAEWEWIKHDPEMIKSFRRLKKFLENTSAPDTTANPEQNNG